MSNHSNGELERVGFWDARNAMLSALGGYSNFRYLFSSSRYQRALRKARRGQLTPAELTACLGHIGGRNDIPAPPTSDPAVSVLADIARGREVRNGSLAA